MVLTGNLKHKDLTGQVVSSQAYVDDQDKNGDEEDPMEAVNEDPPASVSSEEDQEEME